MLARGHPLRGRQQMSGVGLGTCNTHTTHNSTVQYDVVFTYDVRNNEQAEELQLVITCGPYGINQD